jgi:hypothetical protein
MRLTPPSRNPLLVLLAAVLTAVCLRQPKPEEDVEAVRRWWSGEMASAGDVTGTVSYKGKALGSGTIQFLGGDRAAYPAKIGADGTYRVRVRVGEARVLLSSIDEERMVEHLQKLSDFPRGNKTGAAPKVQLRRASPSA